MAFYAWYDRENQNAARPRDVGKFAEHWLKWKATQHAPGNGAAGEPVDDWPKPVVPPGWERVEADNA